MKITNNYLVAGCCLWLRRGWWSRFDRWIPYYLCRTIKR